MKQIKEEKCSHVWIDGYNASKCKVCFELRFKEGFA
jgi:hypothetical protein